MYQNGEGVPKNKNTAVYWITSAADQGLAWAQYSLGMIYYTGDGALPDYEKAIEWYTKAAENGNIRAQFTLGLIYDNHGHDEDQILDFYTEASRQGYSSVFRNL
jgi:uncharacterized protein